MVFKGDFMNLIGFFNFIQGIIILADSVISLLHNTPVDWAGKHFSSNYNILGILMGLLLIISSLGIFIKKRFGQTLTFFVCIIVIVYSIFTVFYGNVYLVNYYSSIPFAILTQIIVILYIGIHYEITDSSIYTKR